MEALVLERTNHLQIRDIPVDEEVGPSDVRVRIHTVGICGSDVHYYQHGRIGPFVVNAPMILGHEAAGVVVDRRRLGGDVELKEGDRVCMEPGIPDPASRGRRASASTISIRRYASGRRRRCTASCARPWSIPADFTFKLPDNVSLRGGGDGRAAGRRHARRHQSADPAGRPRRGDRRRADRHGDDPGRPRRRACSRGDRQRRAASPSSTSPRQARR